MAELATLARPYAEAAFKQAKETKTLANWSAELFFLSHISCDQGLGGILLNPKVSKEAKTSLLLDICEGQVSENAKNLVKLLVENGKVALLPEIARMFESYKSEDEGYVNVQLYSAFELSKEEQSKYVKRLEKVLKKKVEAKVFIDSDLIGGILARAGDKVLDGSIRGQITQLAKQL